MDKEGVSQRLRELSDVTHIYHCAFHTHKVGAPAAHTPAGLPLTTEECHGDLESVGFGGMHYAATII